MKDCHCTIYCWETPLKNSAMIWAFLAVSLLSSAWSCPEEALPPCKCRTTPSGNNDITCVAATNIDDLQISLQRMKDRPVDTLRIIDSSLMYFPSDMFEGFSIGKLHLIFTTLRDLSDTGVAFKGLENSLKTLIMQGCAVFNGWTWSELRNLTSLTALRTVKSGLDIIDSDIEDIAHLNLDTIVFVQDTISYIDDKAFSHFQNLKLLNIKRNLIYEIKRSMFPNPAPKLTELHLSYNRIETLPDDAFTNMPSLTTLVIAGNKIVTLEKQLVSPVWKQLKKFDFSDSPLVCDCRIKWMLQEGLPPATYAECDKPENLKFSYLIDLKLDDLSC
ncbi:hypothetical protein AVEN_234400-1 [Araneus ventricosus]|uniref:Uncharacterized protein n=1 Tax=Araneus ventricosus TaxID=182803 RepID=A0A4Y2A8B2_ARAVE|nr:hypothetical protein AVEN_234400-1 [Araneus ventricosus]